MSCKLKDSGIPWIGQVPEGWNVVRGKFLLRLLDRPVLDGDGVITCFRDGEVTLRSKRREDGFTISEKESGYQGIDPGDLVVHGMDGFAGSIGISDSRGKATPVLNVLDSDQEKRYLMYYLRAMAFQNIFLALSTGIRVRSCDLGWSKLSVFPFLIPPLPEQKAIAEYLDRKCGEIDGLREKIEKQIATLEEYKKSLITESVTRGLDPNAPMKDSGVPWIGQIPIGWKCVPNKFVLKKKKEICEHWEGQNVLSLTMNGVIVRDIENPVGKMPATFDGYQFVQAGDLLMCLFDYDVTPRTVGRCFCDGVTSPAYSRFLLSLKLTLDYAYYYYLFVDNNKLILPLARNLRHSFNEEEFGMLKMPLPPLPEQKAIADFLDGKCSEIDAETEKCRGMLERLEAYKKALIFECVTGKKEVV